MNINNQAVNEDFYSPNFPYDLPSDLPEDYSYPPDDVEEPICDCFLCQHSMPCSFVKSVLRERGYTAETDWRLKE